MQVIYHLSGTSSHGSCEHMTDFAGVHYFLFASVSYFVHIFPSVRSFNRLVVTLSPEVALNLLLPVWLFLYGFWFNLKILSSVVLSVLHPVLVPFSSCSWLLMWLTCTLFPGYLNPPYSVFLSRLSLYSGILALSRYLLFDSHVWLVCSLFLDFCLLLACLVARVYLPSSVGTSVSNPIKDIALWTLFVFASGPKRTSPYTSEDVLILFEWIFLIYFEWMT